MKCLGQSLLIFYLIILMAVKINGQIEKRALQPSHELQPKEKWKKFFLEHKFQKRELENSMISLIVRISQRYFKKCTPTLIYDSISENTETILINSLLRVYPLPRLHGDVDGKTIRNIALMKNKETCSSFILFIKDVMDTNDVLGPQCNNKVTVVTKSSQWRIHQYLTTRRSQKIVNLLIIAESEMVLKQHQQLPYVLYTHKLYIDAIASSRHEILTSWRNGRFTRPNLDLFPKKMSEGFAGHRFIVAVADQPPFTIKRGIDSNDRVIWDGLEVRLIKLLSKVFNFTIEFKEAEQINVLGSADAVIRSIVQKQSNLGISGIFVSNEVKSLVDTSNMFYQDCAAFVTLTSTALPRYRAIMGPFHWTVWVGLTMVYLFAIFPLTFSDKHTLKPLLKNPEEIENMFWYVFGTFTNAFSFSKKKSWTKSDKIATRIFIGFYWIFTIIITACYTGSIIAFVTLPVYPQTIDSVSQLLEGRYQIGTLDKAGWVNRFTNSSDPLVKKLLKKVDLVPTIDEGIRNTTTAFFWPYAFLGSRANLDYILRTRYVSTGKRSLLHISNECLVSYGVAILFPKNSEYEQILSSGLDRILQSGLINKLRADVEWSIMRSGTGKRLPISKEHNNILTLDDRALTLEDTQGMFLLLVIGYVLGGACLLSEFFGGCLNLCKGSKRFKDNISIPSNPRSYDGLTPRQNENQRNFLSSMVSFNLNNFESGKNLDHCTLDDKSNNLDVKDTSAPLTMNYFGCETELEKHIDMLFDFEDVFGQRNEHSEKNFSSTPIL
ncbi:hypothetical protein WA026_005303 [Henosepilachna vigintioctopunctata]|uniref:Ionotropic glutamate receptor C-terminal domain-containing protein n=1 Tax=Henosepilachna vigintioctopunctata TaxID=420089 RepID=A0AAW1UT78_9CUCU